MMSSPTRFSHSDAQVLVGTSWGDRDGFPLNLVAPSGEVAPHVDRHADVRFQRQSVNRSSVDGLEGGEFFLEL